MELEIWSLVSVWENAHTYLTHSEGWDWRGLGISTHMVQERQACWERQPCYSESRKPAEGRDDAKNEEPLEWQKLFYDLLVAALLTTTWHTESNTLAFAEHMLSAAVREACCSTWTIWHQGWLQWQRLNAFSVHTSILIKIDNHIWGKNHKLVKPDNSVYQQSSISA